MISNMLTVFIGCVIICFHFSMSRKFSESVQNPIEGSIHLDGALVTGKAPREGNLGVQHRALIVRKQDAFLQGDTVHLG